MKKNWVKIIFNEIHKYQKVLYWYEKLGYNFYYYYLKLRDFITGKQTLLHFVYETNTQCTLSCKECHSWMPYFPKEAHHMTTFESFRKEIDKLLKSVDLIPSFRLQGGETLLVKDLAKIVEYACSKKQIQHIQIITNGTIVPSKELINAMKNPKVLLSMSDYSCNKELEGRLHYNEIKTLCKENGVNAKHFLTAPGALWVSRNQINNENITDIRLAKENLATCWCFGIPKAIILFHGKLYICAPAIYYASTNPEFKIPNGEIIDVVNTPQKRLTNDIKEFVAKKIFLLCSRCTSKKNEKVTSKPGVQLEKDFY